MDVAAVEAEWEWEGVRSDVVLLVPVSVLGRPRDRSWERDVNAEPDNESLVLLLSLDFLRIEGGFELDVED